MCFQDPPFCCKLGMLARSSGCSVFDFKFNPCEFAAFASFLACSLFLASLLAGKCSLAFRGRGARVCLSNPRTQTNPAKQQVRQMFGFFSCRWLCMFITVDPSCDQVFRVIRLVKVSLNKDIQSQKTVLHSGNHILPLQKHC